MNKKIKVIELLKRIEKYEDIPKKIKYKDNCYIFKHANYSIDHLYELKEGYDKTYIGWLEHKDINLFDEVEILEDNTEEIEELQEFDIQGLEVSGYSMAQAEYLLEDGINENRDKVNELVKAVNQIRKDLNKC